MAGPWVFYGHRLESLLELQMSNKIILGWEATVKLDLAKLVEGTEPEQKATTRQGLA